MEVRKPKITIGLDGAANALRDINKAHSEILGLIRLGSSETAQAIRLTPAEVLRQLSEPKNAEALRALFKDFNEKVVPGIEIPANADREAIIAQHFRDLCFHGIFGGDDATAFEALLTKPGGNLDIEALTNRVAASLGDSPTNRVEPSTAGTQDRQTSAGEKAAKPDAAHATSNETGNQEEPVKKQAQLDAKKEINKILNLLDPRQLSNQRELTHALESLDEALNKYNLVQDTQFDPKTTYGEILTRIGRLEPISPQELGIVHKGAWDNFTKHAQDLEAQKIANEKALAEARNSGSFRAAFQAAMGNVVGPLLSKKPVVWTLVGGFALYNLGVNNVFTGGKDSMAAEAMKAVISWREGKPQAEIRSEALEKKRQEYANRLNETNAAAQIVGGEATALSSQGMLGRQPPASGAAGTTVTNFKDAWDTIDKASIPAELKGELKAEWNKINKGSTDDHVKLEAFTQAARGFVSERYHSDTARKATFRALHLGN